LKSHFRNVDVAIARTRGEHKDITPIREIEALYLDMIARARRFVYAENQFFASRAIGEAIAKRLAEPDGPEFLIVNPRSVQGWIEDEAMSPARAKLMKALREADSHGRFRIYTPVTKEGEAIYVHSKITIVDGEMLRVGSANLNNRSLGLDTECDLLLDSGLAANGGAEQQIMETLADLLGEHLGVEPELVAKRLAASGSLLGTVEALRGSGRTLVPLEIEEPNALEAALAERELLDPQSAGGPSEPKPRVGLLGGIRAIVRRHHDRRAARRAED
jgi:phosphatidylserine/phosphatidylglycerophosphate/cardiolipin synthase-like enzyme